MKTLALMALTLPFGPAPQSPPETWSALDVMGLTLFTGPATTSVGFSGVTSTMPVKAAGGEGTLTLRQGLTRDVAVTIRDADVRSIAGLFDLPVWLKPKLVGRVSLVTLDVKGDRFELKATGFRVPGDPVSKVEASGDLKARTVTVKAFALGGVLEYDGKLPGE
jgi:hypothetical protein